MITCDICKAKVCLPNQSPNFSPSYELELNGGTILLCDDCYIAVSELIRSTTAKIYCAKYRGKVI